MTAQASDHIDWNGKDYSVIREDPFHIFHPKSLGITPVSYATFCWAGYIARYAIKEDRLFVKSLTIGLSDLESPPTINGMEPDDPTGEYYLGHRYENLWLPLEYSGVITVGGDWVGFLDRGNHGNAPGEEFEEVKECTFEKGELIKVCDFSQQYAEKRDQIIKKMNKEEELYLLAEEKKLRRKRLVMKIKSFFTRKQASGVDKN